MQANKGSRTDFHTAGTGTGTALYTHSLPEPFLDILNDKNKNY